MKRRTHSIEKTTRVKAELRQLRRAVSPEKIREQAVLVYEKEEARLTKLRDDAIRVLQLLVEKGVVSQEELNSAVSGGD